LVAGDHKKVLRIPNDTVTHLPIGHHAWHDNLLLLSLLPTSPRVNAHSGKRLCTCSFKPRTLFSTKQLGTRRKASYWRCFSAPPIRLSHAYCTDGPVSCS
jgi:hypothetical protein